MTPEVLSECGSNGLSAKVVRDIAVLLNSVPARYLTGLRYVRLTTTTEFTRSRRRAKVMRRGRKVAVAEAAGMYHQAWRDSPASIELLLDNLFVGAPSWAIYVPVLRRSMLASTFFHELGHHLHFTLAPQHAGREDEADRWSRRLRRRFFFRRYWYFMPIVYPLIAVSRVLKWSHRGTAA